MMERVLGIDYGTVRIGLAVSDLTGLLATPLDPVDGRQQDDACERIKKLCEERQIGRLVVGLPRHMDGSEGQSADEARALGDKLSEMTGLQVVYLDERMTSMAAERILIEADMSRKKRKEKIDGLAAAIILQTYLDQQI